VGEGEEEGEEKGGEGGESEAGSGIVMWKGSIAGSGIMSYFLPQYNIIIYNYYKGSCL
jgi:hypothetical protein